MYIALDTIPLLQSGLDYLQDLKYPLESMGLDVSND
jgi:hypothetical protein